MAATGGRQLRRGARRRPRRAIVPVSAAGLAALLLALALAAPGPATAQSGWLDPQPPWSRVPSRPDEPAPEAWEDDHIPDRGDAESPDRPRPVFSSTGVRVGPFQLRPVLATALAYDDNVLAAPSRPRTDLIARVSPGASLAYEGGRVYADLSAGADRGIYWTNTSENYLDLGVQGFVRNQVARDYHTSLRVSGERRHEPRRAVDTADGLEPTTFRVGTVEVVGAATWQRRQVRLETSYRVFDYDDVAAAGGGKINNDDRDYALFQAKSEARQSINKTLTILTRVTGNQRTYARTPDDRGFFRGSDGLETVAGVAVTPSPIHAVTVYAGHRIQRYDDPLFPDVESPIGGFEWTWEPSRRTRIRLSVDRDLLETTLPFVGARRADTSDLKLDHELTGRLLLHLGGLLRRETFLGVARTDVFTRYSAGLTYLMGPRLQWTLDYVAERRRSGVAANDYRRNIAQLGLTLRY